MFGQQGKTEGSSRSRLWLMVGMVVLLGVVVWRSGGPVEVVALDGWSHVLGDVESEATNEADKPTLMLFTADWCPPCQVLKKDVLKDPAIAARLPREFRLVVVDLTEPTRQANAWADRFEVSAIPEMVILDTEGEAVSRIVGSMGREAFVDWIDKGLAAMK